MGATNQAEPALRKTSGVDRFIRTLMRGESGPARIAKRAIGFTVNPRVLRLPALFRPVFSLAYLGRWTVNSIFRLIASFFRGAMFQSRCAAFGRGVRMEGPMPFVLGYPQMEIGNDCYIGGRLNIISGRAFDQPRFVMKDRAEIGWDCTIVATKEVVIEEGARLAARCSVSDTDGHPREADRRFNNEAPDLKDIRPVRIGKYAWIGNSSHIMKGVTIGEGAIVAANSVVIGNVPPYALAMGNPAEVFMKNYGLPASMKGAARNAPPD